MNTSVNDDTNFRRRVVFGFLGLVLTAALCLIYGFFVEPNRLVLNSVSIDPAGLEKGLDGLRIVAISDLHGGSNFIDEAKLRDITKRVNEQNPDLIVILGDFVSQARSGRPVRRRPLKMSMQTIADSIKGLRAKYGVFAVEGNHDYWFNSKIVFKELERVGIRVLHDQLTEVDVNGTRLTLLGLRDHMSVRSGKNYNTTIKEVVSDVDSDLIVLTHSPDFIPYLTGPNSISDKTRLFIAGHTHGGQVWLPLIGSPMIPSNYGQTFAAGHLEYNNTDVFVTTGIGTSIMPVRFLVPPEIAVITLGSG
ncbi:MAG: metallophosphoesterase [Pyrinomonadaceae bacterium]|nr:metallophosphoesterase [Pyrinomonadaceae bacterium]